jgi:hypothetical protein
MIKYLIVPWKETIEKVEIIRETPKFVVRSYQTYSGFVERRESKQGYFDTWKEALDWLIDRAVRNIEFHKTELADAEKRLEALRNLHED